MTHLPVHTPEDDQGEGMSEIAEATYHVIADIQEERFRQISAEGWTTEHDDAHTQYQLARAAGDYAMNATLSDAARKEFGHIVPADWPWEPNWWKPTDRRRDLVKAAALIVAEIERLDRHEAKLLRSAAFDELGALDGELLK